MTLEDAATLYGTLQIETDNNYFWSKSMTKSEQNNIMTKLRESLLIGYRYYWDSPVIQRFSAGGLVMQLNKNYKSVLINQNMKKLYVYSTHDTKLAPVMLSLGLFNDYPVPFGATLILELHEKKDSRGEASDYFVRAFFHNSTVIDSGTPQTPHPLQWTICGNLFDCPFDQYLNSTKHLYYSDYDKDCNQTELDYY